MRMMRLSAFLVCPISLLAQPPTNRVHLPHTAHLSSQFGLPRHVETGTEEQPPNQGFLQCVISQLSPVYRQGNTADLFVKLGTTPSGNDAVIVGHGAPGIICTGDGDHCNGELDKMISAFNIPQWQSLAQSIKGKFRTITFLGCDVGAHQGGSTLMKDFANASGAIVIAADAIVFCGDGRITLADGGHWIRSDGRSVQSPAKSPGEPRRGQVFRFRTNSEFTTIPLSSVKIVSLSHRDYLHRDFQQLHLRDDHSLLTSIDFESPATIKAQPGAIVTGHLVLRWNVRDRLVERKFILYNDELLEDEENIDVFYKTTASFREQIAALAR